MNTVHKAAKKYVNEWRCSVIPLRPRSKIPALGEGEVMPYKSRRPDNGELNEWFGDHPQRGVAILCGDVSGRLLALDVDQPDKFATWTKAHPELAKTRRQKTLKGYHLVFYIRNGASLPSDGAFYWQGEMIGEIRWKGYITAEPSIHEDTGHREHRWINPEDPILEIDNCDVLGLDLSERTLPPEIPGHTVAGDAQSAYAKKALANELAMLAMTGAGQRNNQLNKAAFSLGQLIGGGLLDRNEIEQALTATAAGIGLEQRETRATIRSGIEAGIREPRTPPEGWDQPKPQKLGGRLPQKTAEFIEKAAPPCPDAELQKRVTETLLEKGPLKDVKRKAAGRLLLAWLQEHGRFIWSTTDGRLCYFYTPEKRLLNLETNFWRAWLYALTGANPAGTDFAYLDTDCKTAAQFGEEREVVKVAAWDEDTQTLRVSRFDGTVYVLHGERITEEDNGAHVLFDDLSWWQPYSPNLDQTSGTALRWSTEDISWFDGKRELHGLGYRAWVLATFFTELCPTRPLLVFLGEKGSGKTMMLRIFLQLLFGPGAQVTGVPDKPDGFTAAASANHILVLDNLDQFTPWLRDKLARLSTGAIDQYRRLYTSNEVGTVRYRTWIALTARTPDTLRRDDLADRLLLLPTCCIPDDKRQPERHFLVQVKAMRDDWWGDVLNALNGMVASMRRGELAIRSDLRMADWESLGRLVARHEGNEDLWDECVRNLKTQQSGFLLSDDLLVEGLDEWMKDEMNHGRPVKASELYGELTDMLFTGKNPPRDWPKSTSGFGKKLAGIRDSLRTLYRVKWWQERNYWIYQFEPLGKG